MELYRAQVKRRMWFELGVLLFVIFLTTPLFFVSTRLMNPTVEHRDFLYGFAIGLSGSMVVKTGVRMWLMVRLLHNPEKLEQSYIRSTDERECYLMLKTAQAVLNILLNALALATIVSAFFSQVVTITLASVIVAFMAILVCVNWYYHRKL